MARPRKPTSLKLIQGTLQKCRTPKDEPVAEISCPICPDHITGPAKSEWDRITSSLLEMGVMSKHDGPALEIYCTSYAEMLKARAGVEKIGMLIKTPNGYPVKNPLITIANEAENKCLKILVEFGLTPASRSKVSANKDKKPANKFSNNGQRSKG